MPMRRIILLFLLLISKFSHAQFYNGYDMQFGKNRVQYDDRFWSFMKFKNFDTYYYLGGLELAKYTGIVADKDLNEIEQLFDYSLDGRIQFIIYNKLSDLKQSNIGLETEDQSNNTGGVTRIVGNKVFLYFNGSHEQLRQQIRAGIAQVLIDQIMFGGDVKDRIQNAALLSLPNWYIQGLVTYVSRGWDVEIDNQVRDGIVSGRFFKFNHLTGSDAVYAGHSIWKYIVDLYSDKSISSLLYMTRVNRNIESGFLYVLGTNMKELSDSWKNAMIGQYADSDVGRDSITAKAIIKKPKQRFNYSQFKLSPDARYATYVTNELGKYRVYLYDLEKNKKKKIKKGGFKSYIQQTDVSFPLIAWHPGGKLFATIRERKGKILLGFYTLETKKFEESPLFNFEKVLDFSYSDDGQLLLLSAVQKGQSDIFVYNLRSRTYEQITKDLFDDLHPRFVNKMRGIVFSSNRINDTLDIDKRELPALQSLNDIFYYDYAGKSKTLKRITATPSVNESQPIPYDQNGFAYLSDDAGIINRYYGKLDSALSYIDTTEHYRMIVTTDLLTNYSRNIQQHDVNRNQNRVGQIIYQKGKQYLYVLPLSSDKTTSQNRKTLFRNEVSTPVNNVVQNTTQVVPLDTAANVPVITDSNAVNIDNYIFQSDFEDKKKKEEPKIVTPVEAPVAQTGMNVDSAYIFPKQRNYETAFNSNYFTSQLDISLLNGTYQAFTGGGAVFYNPGLNGFFKIGISDLMEDYRITGGFKLAADLNANEYYLSLEDLKKRTDKQYTFYRQARFLNYGFFSAKVHTHEFRYLNKFPFSDVSALRLSFSYRNDRLVYLSTDNATLKEPNQYLNWGSGRLEYIFDNTLPTGLNLYNGIRFKLFAEYYRQIDKKKTGMYVLGADFRTYTRLHREIIWANRLAASTSFGEEKIIYYLGSTNNWLVPKFNNETVIDYTQPYAYQALATNLRGFSQNIRNGNSFAVINSEIRVPLFRYILNRPIKSDFIRNFQVIAFGDIGTAWNGSSPYDSTSSLNNKFITNPTYDIVIISQNEPLVGGYGFGLRSRLLGYFMRADWSYGIENGEQQPRLFYFSLGLDF